MATKKSDQVLFGEEVIVTVGQFPLRKEGSLKISELRWIEKVGRKKMQMAKPLMELAQYISKAEGMTEREAIAAVQDGDSNTYLALKYADRFELLADSQYTDLDQKVDMTMMMLNSRVSKDFLKDNAQTLFDRYELMIDVATKTITSLGDLPESVLDEILEFTANERSKWAYVESDESEEDPALGE
jgi:hypothetical protein